MGKMIITAALLCTVLSGNALAEGGSFGLGVIVGEPTGIDGKWFMSKTTALEGAAAWSMSGDNEFQLQLDYKFHNYSLITVKEGELPVYFGIGGRIAFRDNADDNLGIRIPVGLSYLFANAPLDVFGEIVPVMELTPDTDFDLEGAIGIRYFF